MEKSKINGIKVINLRKYAFGSKGTLSAYFERSQTNCMPVPLAGLLMETSCCTTRAVPMKCCAPEIPSASGLK